MITPEQCRGARGLLKWTQEDLAKRSEVSVISIRKFEGGKTSPRKSTLKVFRLTFENAGIEFIDDNGIGVKLRQ